MPVEIAARPFVPLGGGAADGPFLAGLRADVLSALAARGALKVYAATFEPPDDFGGHVLSVAAVRAGGRLHALVAVRAPGGLSRAAPFEVPLAAVARAADGIAALALDAVDGRPLRAPAVGADDALSEAAYERLLLARHHALRYTPADNEAALAHFGAVLAEAPDHPPALAGLAATLFQQIRYGALDAGRYPDVRDAAARAVAADPGAVQGHVVLALVAMYHDRDFRAAADAFADALALDRDHVDVLKEYAWLLLATGHDAEAAAAIDRALAFDPLSVDLLCSRADVARYAGDPAAANAAYRRAHALDLRYARAIEGVASTAAALGDRDEALRHLDLYRRHAPTRYWRYRPMGEIAARFGDAAMHAEAVRALDAYAREHPEADLSGDLASVLATTDPDRAMGHLADAYRRGVGVVSVLRYPVFEPLRARPDYRALVADLDLAVDVPAVAVERTARIRIPDGAGPPLVLPRTAVVAVEAQRNYVAVHARQGGRARVHLARTSLSALVGPLGAEGFVRVHHSHLANLGLPGWRIEGNAHTARLRHDRTDVAVPVSRGRYADVRAALAG